MKKTTVCRCPKCGSTNAVWDESRSVLEFTHMQCNDCGHGGLCDSWERDSDWFVAIDLEEGEALPARVAPLGAGEWFYDHRPPAPAPASTLGCVRCLAQPDATAAWNAFMEAERVCSLVDESHFDVQIRRCSWCETHLAQAFTERIDWVNGEDDQLWLVVPVEAREVSQLQAAAADRVPGLLEELAGARRFLVRSHPSGASVSTWWRESGFSIGPHD